MPAPTPDGFSDDPFKTIPGDEALGEGPLAGAKDWFTAIGSDPRDVAADRLKEAGLGSSGRPWSVSSGWQDRLLAGARGAQGPAASPFDANYANQARAAQMALIQQMRGQMNGPSLAGMQGQRALGQSGQQALAAAANGAPNRAAMLGAQGVAGGLAGDVGRARLAEVMRAQAGMGGVAGQMRGADQQSSLGDARAQANAQAIRDSLFRFYAGTGAQTSLDDLNYQLDQKKIAQRALRGAKDESSKAWQDAANMVASMFSMGAGVKK